MKGLFHLIILCMLVSVRLYAQTDSLPFKENRPTFIGVNLDYGFLIKHTESLRNLDNSHPSALSLDWSKLLLTQKAWDFCNCFPKVGVNVAYWNWDSPKILGNGVLTLAFAEPYFRTQKKTNIFFTMGLGGAYLTNPYDVDTNPNNESYSTSLSFALVAGLGINYRLTEQLNIRLAAKYNHTSNGGVRTPNKGLNFPTLSLGIHTSLNDVEYPYLSRIGKREAPEDKMRFSFAHFSGWSNANVGDKDKFYVFGLSVNYSRWLVNRSALTAGTEWIFDYSRKEQIKIDDGNASFLQGSALVGHEFWLGKVTFVQQLSLIHI